jgi:hypothetical protein
MLKIQISGYTIHKTNPSLFLFERKHKFSYLVKVTNKGITCNCREFYKYSHCGHSTIAYNMMYIVDLDKDSTLHQKYWDLLNLNGLGKDLNEDFKIRLESLDEVTFEDEKMVVGKYYSRLDGKFIMITINK